MDREDLETAGRRSTGRGGFPFRGPRTGPCASTPHEDTLRRLVESRDEDDEYVIHLTNDIAFATDALTALRAERSFEVDVRPSTDPALVIEVGDRR
ncbi:hypothetical protein AB0P36_04305 [Streptomyces flavidovirens]|uniref:hypothetical protein n=1 Tax=Streptomyces flavidovirens TaxID=67298 RepID=UPI003412E63A